MKTTSLSLMAVVALALAGCTASPPPEETESGCSPENATFEWGTAAEGSEVLLGVQLLEYTDGASRSSLEVRDAKTDSGFPDAQLAAIGVPEEGLEAWHAALIAAARDSGAVAEGFETSTSISEKPYVDITTPEDGRYVVSVMAPLTTVSVTISCADGAPVEGDLVGLDPALVRAVPLLCVPDLDEPATEDAPDVSLETATAREYCAKA
jgi:hypothetical protein